MASNKTKWNSLGYRALLCAVVILMIHCVHGSENAPLAEIDQTFAPACEAPPPPPPDAEEPDLTLEYLLTKGTEFMENYTDINNAIFMLGNTGSGKSTVTQIVAGNMSRLHVYQSGIVKIIVDEDQLIGLPTTKSKTLFPNMVREPITDDDPTPLAFFDCPGFDDNRGAIEDIATNFFMNQLTTIGTNIKMLFLVNYSSTFLSERLDFPKLITHAATFVKDIQKYSKSFALLVNKSPNLIPDSPDPLPDEFIIKQAAIYLSEHINVTRQELSGDPEQDALTHQKIYFMETLLEKDSNGNYTKIWPVRNPMYCGPLNDSEIHHKAREDITDLYERLEYTRINPETDFGFTLKSDTELEIIIFKEAINANISSAMAQLTNEQEKFYFEAVNPIKIDDLNLTALDETMRHDSSSLSNILNQMLSGSLHYPLEFYELLQQFWSSVKMTLPSNFEKFMESQDDLLIFFDKATGNEPKNYGDIWSKPLQGLSKTFGYHKNWFEFCRSLEDLAHKYDFQKNRQAHPVESEPENWLDFLANNSLAVVKDSDREAATNVTIEAQAILNKLMNFSMGATKTSCMVDANAVVIQGNYILAKEIPNVSQLFEKCPNSNQLLLYASHTVFMDTDLTLTDADAVVLAPLWVQPNVNQGNLLLAGQNGEEPYQKPPVGSGDAGSGKSGIPGKPGSPGGTLFGIALKHELINLSSNWTIESRGGAGGNGQEGGDAADMKYRDALDPTNSHFDTPDTQNDHYVTDYAQSASMLFHRGIRGQDGKAGGHGGVGGYGGISQICAKIEPIDLSNDAKFDIKCPEVRMGANGTGGSGGLGSLAGNGYACLKFLRYSCEPRSPEGNRNYNGATGAKGKDGFIKDSLQPPKPPREITHWDQILRYRTSFPEHTHQITASFLQEIDASNLTSGLFTLTSLAEESLAIENYVRNEKISKVVLADAQKSLITRLERFVSRNPHLSLEHQKVVAMLMASSQSSILSLGESRDRNVIVDVATYIDVVVTSQIKSLQTSTALANIKQIQTTFSNNLQEKVIQANNFLVDIVTPAIEDASKDITSKLEISKRQIISLVTDAKISLQECREQLRKAEDKQKLLKAFKVFDFIGSFALSFIPDFSWPNFGSMINEVADSIGGSQAEVDKLKGLVEEAGRLVADMEQMMADFNREFVPLVGQLLSYFKNVSESLNSGGDINHPQLGFTKKQIVTKLKECQNEIEGIADNSLNVRPMLTAFNRLQDAMTMTIDLYEMIDQYLETQMLGDYIANVYSAALGPVPITDPQLKHTVVNFTVTLQQNMLDQEVKKAMYAFKQWVFPFAKFFFPGGTTKRPRLAGSGAFAGEDELLQMERLSLDLKRYKTESVGDQDTFIFQTNFSSTLVTSKPFFVWKNAEWKAEIQSLLSGYKVNFNADVRLQNFTEWEAIKFKQIEVNLKLKDASSEMQQRFDQLLLNFGVSMTHSGASNFRFQNDYFVMTNSNQTLMYNFERDWEGNRLGTNLVYNKFKNGDYLLSPFTVWTIQLRNAVPLKVPQRIRDDTVSFDDLAEFLPHIDVELVGTGTYVDGKAAVAAAGGNMELGKWYERDEIMRIGFDFKV